MPGSQNPSLNLILENIGPIKRAEIELGRVTILYGANAAGKTTVARSIEYLIKLMNNIGVECSELMELINYGAKVGRIVLNDYEVSLERSEGFEKVNVTIRRGAETLHSGGCGVNSTYLTGLHVGELGVNTLVWVGYSDVRLIGAVEGVLNLEALLKPSIKKYFSSEKVRAAKEYDDYIYEVNHRMSPLGWFEVQDEVFLNDGDFYYELDHVAEGIKRAALIIAGMALAGRLKKGRPLIFVEGFKPLHIDLIRGILDEIEDSEVPSIIETHSGFVLKYAVKRGWNTYVLKDGVAYNDLTKPELFNSEAVVASEVGEIL
jgi:energy-coupling factor transporter ATP-binding protein EcfA2